LDLLKLLDDHRALGLLYHNLALEEARQRHWDESVALFKQALDAHRIVGNEEGLAITYSRLGKTFLDSGNLTRAERCLNNASEHFIKLGNEPGEAAVLRLLAEIYIQRNDRISATRCLERALMIDQRYHLPNLAQDTERLDSLRPDAGR
jgi:tetratricopeptide (TPR) repeat protein